MTNQLTIDFKPSVYGQYGNINGFFDGHVIPKICQEKGILKKAIAADLDLSPSHFAQKLTATGGSRLTGNDIEKICRLYDCYMEVIKYYAYQQSKVQPNEALEAQIASLQAQLKARTS